MTESEKMAEASRDILKVRVRERGRLGWWMTVSGREEETESFKKNEGTKGLILSSIVSLLQGRVPEQE